MYVIIMIQTDLHCGNCKVVGENRIQVIANRKCILYLVLVLYYSGKQCLAFPYIVCQNGEKGQFVWQHAKIRDKLLLCPCM